jgi:hypothetical protein
VKALLCSSQDLFRTLFIRLALERLRGLRYKNGGSFLNTPNTNDMILGSSRYRLSLLYRKNTISNTDAMMSGLIVFSHKWYRYPNILHSFKIISASFPRVY